MKTSELIDQALDWAVTYALYGEQAHYIFKHSPAACRYSTSWSQGGPIIELDRICIDIGHDGVWLAYSKQNYGDEKAFMHSGNSPLTAAMRAYVAMRLGDEVDVPEELV